MTGYPQELTVLSERPRSHARIDGNTMRVIEDITVRSNLRLTMRERGKIRARREGHNIWLNLGREYLANLISLSSYGPDVPQEDHRIKYMGLGIGGSRQVAPGVANVPPLSVAYPGTNLQTDTDPTVLQLERPVRISGSTTGPSDPYALTDVWLGTVQAPPIHTTATEATFFRVFTQTEVSYSSFITVPLSEIMLFTSAANPVGRHDNTGVAYDTFDTLSKTGDFALECEWTIRM
jgi:hypothetical protein